MREKKPPSVRPWYARGLAYKHMALLRRGIYLAQIL
jgi:hypothetical protein